MSIVKVGETSEYLDEQIEVHVDTRDNDYTKLTDADGYVLLLSEEQVIDLRDLLNKVIEIHNS